MRRTKSWWRRLNRYERAELVALERASNSFTGSSPYLPEGCGDCPSCSTPSMSGALCRDCSERLERILKKAEAMP